MRAWWKAAWPARRKHDSGGRSAHCAFSPSLSTVDGSLTDPATVKTANQVLNFTVAPRTDPGGLVPRECSQLPRGTLTPLRGVKAS